VSIRTLRLILFSCAALWAAVPGFAQTDGGPLIVRARLADTIHPITAEYVVQSLAEAEEKGADLFVLQLDTPGGLDLSMRAIIQAFLASDVPVCLYVGPSGARAASAGFFMAMAADVVAMAPGTNMGAASPVTVGGSQPDETMQKKLIQDAEAYIRSLAEQRARSADRAAEAVTDGRSYAANEAVELGLADFLAEDLDAVIAELDGSTLRRDDTEWALDLAAAEVIDLEMSTRQRLLAIIANPQIAYLLLLLGLAGLYFELSTPGAVLPGVLGGLSLVLAMLAFQVLPINFAGLALIGLAVLFFILEVKVTSYGLLTVAGLVAFVLGSLMLVPGPIPEMRLQVTFVLPTALAVVGVAAFLLSLVVRTHRGQVQTGVAALPGSHGRATRDIGEGGGEVFVHGERWRAVSTTDIPRGDAIEVVDLEEGMTLRVRPREPSTG
jgi:membrane-bound serine protease (ClpP class)